MDKRDWLIRHLAHRLVWLGDCTLKRMDMETCPLTGADAAASPADVCAGCILESIESDWEKESKMEDGIEKV